MNNLAIEVLKVLLLKIEQNGDGDKYAPEIVFAKKAIKGDGE